MTSFFNNKNILVTGHTGFKGSWISLFLYRLGAKIVGFSDGSIKSGMYRTISSANIFDNEIFGDINDSSALEKCLQNNKFDLVFHFAAQGIVSEAKKHPELTLKTNILGTFNILDLCNKTQDIKTLVIATTDKVYEDHNQDNFENFKLGGKEFYSASKASSEHVISAFKNTIKREDLNIGVVRAGNVLGGGDYGNDRLLTDIINSLKENQDVVLRSPKSIRPWQYILDSIYGYLLVAEYCNVSNCDEIFNLNNDSINNYSVLELAKNLINEWPSKSNVSIVQDDSSQLYESEILTINSTKAKEKLDWIPKFTIDNICSEIVNYENSNNKLNWSINHIDEYINSYTSLSK